jgi:hypothetical protein
LAVLEQESVHLLHHVNGRCGPGQRLHWFLWLLWLLWLLLHWFLLLLH